MNYITGKFRPISVLVCLLLALPGFALAGSIHGVIKSGNETITGASVRLLELDRATISGAHGEYSFDKIPTGTYHVFVHAIGYASMTATVQVLDGTAELSFSLVASAIPGEEVVVSASPYARTQSDQYQPVATKDADELHQSPGSTFTEEIDDIPGVAMRYNAAAPSRPIVRGLGDNEDLILENGLRIGDLSTFDPAHATPIEMGEVQEVDIVRGPASILYGSNSIGGLVNVITNTIPMASSQTVSGNATASGNTVNDLYSAHFNTVWSDGSSALGISAGDLHSGNIAIPQGNYTDLTTGLTFNLNAMPQSFMRTSDEGIGYSYQGDFGMIGAGVKHYYSNYGITGDPYDSNQAPSTSRIVQEKYTAELRAQFNVGGSFVNQIRLNSNASDYIHSEFPTAPDTNFNVTPNTYYAAEFQQNSFHQNNYNTTLQFLLQPMGNWQGTFGLWSDLENLTMGGQQPLGPNSLTTSLAGYALEEYRAGDNTKVQGAVRYDYNNISTFASPSSTVSQFVNFNETRTSGAVTGSLGIIQNLTNELTGSINVGRSFRAPTLQELFAVGPDDASAAVLSGDSNLVPETSIGIDMTLTGRFSDFTFSVSPFINFIHNYIYSYDTKVPDSTYGTPYDYRNYAQDTSARLFGAEVSATAQLMDHLALTVSGDYVNAEDVSRDTALPSTPPLRGTLRLNYLDNTYSGMVEWRLAASQTRLGDGDFPIGGYGIVNLGFGVRLVSGEAVHHIGVYCDNVFNKVYYDNLSAVDFFLPMPARGFRLVYDVTF